MIEPTNMFEDLRTDKVGLAIMALRSMQIWNKEKHAVRKLMDKVLVEAAYTLGHGTAAKYRLTNGTGFSYLYRVPDLKRGLFEPLRGQLIRMVYTYSGKNYVNFMYAPVEASQQGRSYLSLAANPLDKDLDVRMLYRYAYGESGFNGLAQNIGGPATSK